MGCRLVFLVSVILLSAAMSNGIRTAGTVGGHGATTPAGPAVATTAQADVVQVTPSPPVVATAAAAAAATTVTSSSSSEQQQQQQHSSLADDPYKDSKRKVPNGPDPIHNRRARWGEAPATRV